MQSTSWEMLGWMKHKLESRLLEEISITSDMQLTPPLWQKWTKTKEPLDESKRKEWKRWLKTLHSENQDHGIQSYHFMANRWGNNGNSEGLFWGVPKPMQMVTAAMKLKDTCSLEEKLCQSLWLCGSQQTVENSERDGNTRPPDLSPQKPVCRSKSKG